MPPKSCGSPLHSTLRCCRPLRPPPQAGMRHSQQRSVLTLIQCSHGRQGWILGSCSGVHGHCRLVFEDWCATIGACSPRSDVRQHCHRDLLNKTWTLHDLVLTALPHVIRTHRRTRPRNEAHCSVVLACVSCGVPPADWSDCSPCIMIGAHGPRCRLCRWRCTRCPPGIVVAPDTALPLWVLSWG